MLPGTNKAAVREEVRQFILAQCDADIREYFAPHGFTLEPLLLQLLRDLRRARHPQEEPNGDPS